MNIVGPIALSRVRFWHEHLPQRQIGTDVHPVFSGAGERHLPNPASLYLDIVEKLTINAVLSVLQKPEHLAHFVEVYVEERPPNLKQANQARASLEGKRSPKQRQMDCLSTGAKALRERLETVVVSKARDGLGISISIQITGKLNALVGVPGFGATSVVNVGSGGGT